MKKILALGLALALAVACLAGCGGNNGGNTPDPVPATGGSGEVTPGGAFPTLTYLYNTSEGHKAIGEYLQQALATAGITMQLENQEWATFLETRKNGDYSIARNGWLADYSDPICFLDMWTTASGNNDVQFGKGANAELAMYSVDASEFGGPKVENVTWAESYDVLISAIKNEIDPEKRFGMMHMAEDMLMETGCIVPLYYYTDLYMIDDAVKGFYSNPLGYKYFNKTTIEGKNEISVCLSSEPQTLDPALNSAVDGATMLAHLFSGLAKWDQDETGKLVIVADCAEELVKPDTTQAGTALYTYKLKDGLTWSDGTPVTAGDFEYAWKRAASTALAADYGYMFELVVGYGEPDDENGLAPLAVTAVDDKTLTVECINAAAYWDELLAFPTYFPVKKDVVANEAWATDPSTYVNNGPYTMSSWEHNSVITLERREDFYDSANVTMGTVKCYLSDDSNNMLTNFKNGEWQLIDDVPNNEIATLKVEYPTEFVIAGQIGTYYVCWNINEEILPSDTTLTGVEAEKARQEIRRAIALLFDRNYICEEIGQAGQVPASSFVAMGMFNPDGSEFYQTAGGNADYYGYYDVSAEAYEDNVAACMEVLNKYYTLSK
ncbi:MAG: hypothetical protein HUJ75_03500 [Parasporobacterium sp.]|nr:hypothetical protein [Parasporobacterium sp.]